MLPGYSQKALFRKEGGTREHVKISVIPVYLRVTGVLSPSHNIRFDKTPGSAEPPSLPKRAKFGWAHIFLQGKIIHIIHTGRNKNHGNINLDRNVGGGKNARRQYP